MTARTLAGRQGRLALDSEEGGPGIPVLFLHSDGGTRRHWDEVRRHLFGERPTAAFDRRGHGGSEPPRNGSFDRADAAMDIEAVADALGWRRFALVGHSGGASEALAFAGLRPSRVAGLLLVDPPPDPGVLPPGMMDKTLKALESDRYGQVVEEHYRAIAGPDEDLADRILADVRATPRATIIGTVKAGRDFSPRDYAARYKGPRLSVIQSQFDAEGALHRLAPGFAHTAIDDVGHWLHLGSPAQFRQILDAFLDGLDDGSGARAQASRPAERPAL